MEISESDMNASTSLEGLVQCVEKLESFFENDKTTLTQLNAM